MAALNHPLENIRVIDLGRHQAGPRCAQVLARMGAEVIKVERLGGEETRYHGPWVKKQSSYWVQYNSGKKSLAMDLRKEEGKEALRKLIKVSDVLIQNFRPGTMEKMGFSYEKMCEVNPGIILASVSGFGQYGPYRDRQCFDPIIQAMSGIGHQTGRGFDQPVMAEGPIMDRTAALHATIGILGAVVGGMIWIQWGARNGSTHFIARFEDLPPELRTGLVPQDRRESLGQETLSPMSIDPLTAALRFETRAGPSCTLLRLTTGSDTMPFAVCTRMRGVASVMRRPSF